jgi:hypothetical protein
MRKANKHWRIILRILVRTSGERRPGSMAELVRGQLFPWDFPLWRLSSLWPLLHPRCRVCILVLKNTCVGEDSSANTGQRLALHTEVYTAGVLFSKDCKIAMKNRSSHGIKYWFTAKDLASSSPFLFEPPGTLSKVNTIQ